VYSPEQVAEHWPVIGLCREGNQPSQLCLAARLWRAKHSCDAALTEAEHIGDLVQHPTAPRSLTRIEKIALAAIVRQTNALCASTRESPAPP
jgi:hypothetical protein